MDIALFFTVFMTLFLVELPDKTFIATLVLATKYRPLYVWLGVSAAFLVQTVVAVLFGAVINALPETPCSCACSRAVSPCRVGADSGGQIGVRE